MPTLTKTTVTYHVERPDGSPWRQSILFQLIPGGYDAVGMAPGTVVYGSVDAYGDGQIDLWANEGGVASSRYRCILPSGEQFDFTVPVSGGPYTLSELREAGHTATDPQFPALLSLIQWIDVKLYGAKGDGATDDATSINAAVTAAAALGGGVVYFPPGTYLIGSPILVPSKVTIHGAGREATVIKIKNGANCDAIKSTNFDSLTLTGAWDVSDGVLYAISIKHLTVDGNKANQASGSGIVLFAKNVLVYDVLIHDVKDFGLYSEGGNGAGVPTVQDLPESLFDLLWVARCGNHGILFFGPHDSRFGRVVCMENGGWGFYSGSGATYSGQCEIERLHTYSNVGGGCHIGESSTRCGFIYCDNDGTGGSKLGLEVSAALVQVGQFVGYLCGVTCGSADFGLALAEINLGNRDLIKGLGLGGARARIGCALIYGDGSALAQHAVDLSVGADGTRIGMLEVRDVKGTGSAIRLGLGGAVNDVDIQGFIKDCNVGFQYTTAGVRNRVRLAITSGAGLFSVDTTAQSPSASDIFDITGNNNGTVKRTQNIVSGAFAIDSTGVKTITLNHLLWYTPLLANCQISIAEVTAVDDWAYAFAKVVSVSSSQVVVKVKVSTASGTAGATAQVNLRVLAGGV